MPSPTATAATGRFRVHARHVDHHHARLVDEASFEAAAIAYLEDFDAAADPEVQVIVHDVASGHQQCFRIDTETGESESCAAGSN